MEPRVYVPRRSKTDKEVKMFGFPTNPKKRPSLPGLSILLVAILAMTLAAPALAQTTPGTNPNGGPSQNVSSQSLTQFKSIVGKVVLSEDACGTTGPSCT